MFNNKLWVIACAAALMSVAGCENRSADRDVSRSDSATVDREEGGEVKSEKVTGVKTEEGQAQETGEAEVETQKEVTRSITSEEKVPTVVEGQKKFDINRMSEDDWEALGFPESQAKSIIQYRDQRDGFKSVDDLNQVPGINSQLLMPLKSKLGLTHKQ